MYLDVLDFNFKPLKPLKALKPLMLLMLLMLLMFSPGPDLGLNGIVRKACPAAVKRAGSAWARPYGGLKLMGGSPGAPAGSSALQNF